MLKKNILILLSLLGVAVLLVACNPNGSSSSSFKWGTFPVTEAEIDTAAPAGAGNATADQKNAFNNTVDGTLGKKMLDYAQLIKDNKGRIKDQTTATADIAAMDTAIGALQANAVDQGNVTLNDLNTNAKAARTAIIKVTKLALK